MCVCVCESKRELMCEMWECSHVLSCFCKVWGIPLRV